MVAESSRGVHAAMRARGPAPGRRSAVVAALLCAALATPGCFTTQLTLLKSGLDSLRTQVDVMAARDSVSAQAVEDTRRELAEQKDLVLATRATASSSARETEETLGRLESKLDDIMARFRIASERQPAKPPANPAPGDSSKPAAAA